MSFTWAVGDTGLVWGVALRGCIHQQPGGHGRPSVEVYTEDMSIYTHDTHDNYTATTAF